MTDTEKRVASISKMLRINLTISDFEMDYLSLNNHNEIDEITIPAKIIGVVIYLLGLLGNSSILGILHYEKFGQDSQKRSFADQLFAFNCIIFMIIYPMMLTIDQLRWFYGPIGYTLAISKQYLASCLLCIPLGFTESISFRLLMIYSWKHCAMINDEFCAKFFNTFNFILIQMISMFRLIIGEFETIELFTIFSGVEGNNIEKPRLVVKTNLM